MGVNHQLAATTEPAIQCAAMPLTQRGGGAGKQGASGKHGPAGARGPAGPAMSRADILAVVEDQFYVVRKRLDVQFTRTGEIQLQLDVERKEIQLQLEGQRRETADLRRTVEKAHRLLKRLLAELP